MHKVPIFEYKGQTTPEILACQDTHSHLSILFAFEWGLQAKAHALGGEDKLNEDERLVLAVQALDREVNNGGYHQFFSNSSGRFAPVIVEHLRRIGMEDRAATTERAIGTLGLERVDLPSVEQAIAKKDLARDQMLQRCDEEFYRLADQSEKLFDFIVAGQDKIQLARTDDYPRLPARKELSNVAKLNISLGLWKRGWNPTVEEAQDVARRIAQVRSIPATEIDIESAAVLCCFDKACRTEHVDRGVELSRRAFDLVRNEPKHQIVHKSWVEALIERGRYEIADSEALRYLVFLYAGGPTDQSELGRRNSLQFWAALVKEHRAVLLKSAEFFEANFPEIKLDEVKIQPKIKLKFPKPKKLIQLLSELPEFSSDDN